MLSLRVGIPLHTSTSSTVTATAVVGGNTLSLSLLPLSKSTSAHWSPAFYPDFTSHVWLTQDLYFSPLVTYCPQVRTGRSHCSCSNRHLNTESSPISSSPPSNVGGQVARSDGQVTQVGVVCFEQVNHCLQQHSFGVRLAMFTLLCRHPPPERQQLSSAAVYRSIHNVQRPHDAIWASDRCA